MEDGSLREKSKKAQEEDENIVKVVEELKRVEMKSLRDKEWLIEKGVVMKEGCIYIPEEELREEVVYLYYDILVEGYRERWKMVELVTRNYWWPGVTRGVGKYIDKCNAYQQYKNKSKALVGKLISNAILKKL